MGGSLRLALLLLASLALGACYEHEADRSAVAIRDCSTCHLDEYQVASGHADNFPFTCFECHTTSAWAPSIFSHETAVSECYACHRGNYSGTSDPTHQGLFPTTCDDCHGTAAWRPALMGEHPNNRFSITNGPHDGIACTDCHDPARGASTDGINTDCVGCHEGEHRMSRVNDQHKDVDGYQFDANMPNFCLTCHPNGRN